MTKHHLLLLVVFLFLAGRSHAFDVRVSTSAVRRINTRLSMSSTTDTSKQEQEVSTTATSIQSENKYVQLLRLLLPGEGQSYGNRASLHAINAKRGMLDPQMWTHVFFFQSMFFSYHARVLDLFMLLSITTPLSLLYHYTYEKPGRLAQLEGIAAKALFVYGVVQMFYAPNLTYRTIEFFLFLLTVVIFIGTNFQKSLYEPWHCLMHVIPPIWATVVAVAHKPLIVF